MDDLLIVLSIVLNICLFGTLVFYGALYLYTKLKGKFIKKSYSKFYCRYEPNMTIEKGKWSGDCAIRCATILLGLSWNNAFDVLSKYAKNNGCITSTSWMLYNFFSHYGYAYKETKKDITFGQFAKKHPHGKYAIFSSDHVAALIDGKIYDSWNSVGEIVSVYMELKGRNGVYFEETKYSEIDK